MKSRCFSRLLLFFAVLPAPTCLSQNERKGELPEFPKPKTVSFGFQPIYLVRTGVGSGSHQMARLAFKVTVFNHGAESYEFELDRVIDATMFEVIDEQGNEVNKKYFYETWKSGKEYAKKNPRPDNVSARMVVPPGRSVELFANALDTSMLTLRPIAGVFTVRHKSMKDVACRFTLATDGSVKNLQHPDLKELWDLEEERKANTKNGEKDGK